MKSEKETKPQLEEGNNKNQSRNKLYRDYKENRKKETKSWFFKKINQIEKPLLE